MQKGIKDKPDLHYIVWCILIRYAFCIPIPYLAGCHMNSGFPRHLVHGIRLTSMNANIVSRGVTVLSHHRPLHSVFSVHITYYILILGIWCSTIPHLLGCFCPWTFFENIGFNTVVTDPFMSHLATQLGYSAGEFQALQLIVLVAIGVVDQPLASCMLVHLLEIEF